MKGSLCETINIIVVSELIVRIAPSLRRIPELAKAVGFINIKGWKRKFSYKSPFLLCKLKKGIVNKNPKAKEERIVCWLTLATSKCNLGTDPGKG